MYQPPAIARPTIETGHGIDRGPFDPRRQPLGGGARRWRLHVLIFADPSPQVIRK
jgi:hypothetical protein